MVEATGPCLRRTEFGASLATRHYKRSTWRREMLREDRAAEAAFVSTPRQAQRKGPRKARALGGRRTLRFSGSDWTLRPALASRRHEVFHTVDFPSTRDPGRIALLAARFQREQRGPACCVTREHRRHLAHRGVSGPAPSALACLDPQVNQRHHAAARVSTVLRKPQSMSEARHLHPCGRSGFAVRRNPVWNPGPQCRPIHVDRVFVLSPHEVTWVSCGS